MTPPTIGKQVPMTMGRLANRSPSCRKHVTPKSARSLRLRLEHKKRGVPPIASRESCDGHEIYISVASFDSTYLHWLRNKRAISRPKDSFLNMARYGPWFIDSAEHVAEFAAIILAIMVAEK
ncbi:hypothetical protein N7516_002221 [Penicillium verrucosum]|uniref:uncharacterized protein n=1 Tax=Penicillium verrucosum TaxID=60171 RepID=UPI0025457FE8|nr:uncharacterized protein N7516_002221 [Penicillium verrucosum]KAJ5942053.1 hypothetical protein N7516_002221 [Penicillium verrucosum]